MKTSAILKRYLQAPPVPITVSLIGAGGTGSQLLTHLARISSALYAIDGRELRVNVYDPDRVTEANMARQMFASCDIGRHKAHVLVERVNKFFGFNWQGAADLVSDDNWMSALRQNVIITCTDTKASRITVTKCMAAVWKTKEGSPRRNYFWIDCGNTLTTGNVIIASPDYNWPSIIEHPNWTNKEEANIPSCSLAEALLKQDLFINSWMANIAGTWLWQILRKKQIDWRGAFLNIDSMRMRKIPV